MRRAAWTGALLAAALLGATAAAAPKERAPRSVEITFVDGPEGSPRLSRYQVPLPADKNITDVKISDDNTFVEIRLALRAVEERFELEYQIGRRSARKDDKAPLEVRLAGTITLPTEGVVLGGASATSGAGGVEVRLAPAR